MFIKFLEYNEFFGDVPIVREGTLFSPRLASFPRRRTSDNAELCKRSISDGYILKIAMQFRPGLLCPPVFTGDRAMTTVVFLLELNRSDEKR